MIRALPFRLSLLIATLLLSLSAGAQPPGADRGREVFKIEAMSYNIYLGASIFRVFEPAPCGPLQSVAGIFETVQQTNFPERAEAIADIVQSRRPDVIGLQEVSQYYTQTPADNAVMPGPDDTLIYVPNAEDLEFDFLVILLEALAARGLDYVEVPGATSINADVEFPMATFDESCTPTSIPMDLRLTDRDVLLVRNGLETANATNANFAVNLPVTIPGPGATFFFEFTRGYGAADVTVGKRTYRVANTHLEVGDASDPTSLINGIQFSQALELAGTVAGTNLPLIVLGDFNSSPDPLDPRPAYATMTGSGYLDLWTVRQGPPDPGYTCCQDEALLNGDSELDQRIDHVFSLLPDDATLLPIQSEVVGDAQNERSASGLWPSDHAGVTTTLKFRR